MRRALPILTICALLVPAAASAQGAAVAAHVGTLGLGLSGIVGVSPKLNLRGTLGIIPSDPEFTVDEVDFTVDFPSFFRLTADYYPTGFFYLSGGALFVTNGGEVDVAGEFAGTQDFGGTTYSAADVGSLFGSFGLKSAMPYLGIGFGNPVGRTIGLNFDVGVGFGDVPAVALGATGPIADDPTFISDLNAREAEIQEDIPQLLQYYPVLSLSLSIGFGG